MEIDGIPALASDTDLQKIKPINSKKLLAYINYYITYTVNFVNRFSSVNEERLEEVTTRLQKLEVAMAVLEAKLSSVPGLENVTADSQDQPTVQQQQSTVQQQQSTIQQQQSTATEGLQQDNIQQSEVAKIPPAERVPTGDFIALKDDARYKKFFSMLRVGIPNQAIKLKMTVEGLDPAMLDFSPDDPAPDGGVRDEDDFGSVDGNNSADNFSD
ncbi:WASH complex subunit CCDC53 [Trichoplax sp. H2]|nr:WASH complex subunit CCDC53 [Trichoplax sp. H2]|eukprot:RDD38463.1 WASH complex subunit CCDC53 [Trichoplax sp. H2]